MRVARWTIGPTTPEGLKCLELSIESFLSLYDAYPVLCYNCCNANLGPILEKFQHLELLDQTKIISEIKPIGVAWKLHPTRVYPDSHEISIDNDIVFNERIPEIDEFFKGNGTLLLEGSSRNYGRFEKHVPKGFRINSGIYGMPPGFNLQKYFDFYLGAMGQWEINAFGEHKQNKTFDEQGFVATALLNSPKFAIIPESTVTNCERHLINGKGCHFIGLNKVINHRPFRDYRLKKARMCL